MKAWHYLPLTILVSACSSPDSPEAPAPQGGEPVEPGTDAPMMPAAPAAGGSGAGPTGFEGGGFVEPPADPAGEACESVAVQSEAVTKQVPVEVAIEVPYEVTEEVPKALYIMMDRSGSMTVGDPLFWLTFGACFIPGACDPNAPIPTKWDFAKFGMEQFVDSPGSTDLKVGLGYFPEGGQCDGSGYDTPEVAMAPLPTNAQAVKDSMAAQIPLLDTPTAGALRGLIRYCEQYQVQNPDEQCVGVLITDGAPSECEPTDAGGLANLAAQAASNGIKIYAAGMQGAAFPLLNEVARAGGGDCTPNDPSTWACDLTANQDAFLVAMQEIASQTSTRTRTEFRTEYETQIEVQPVECEYAVPPAPEGKEFDADKVNVRVTAAGESRTVGRVPSEPECANFQGGWFYDDPANPTKVSVCPATCEVLQGVQDQTVEVLFGCKSEIAEPR